MSQQRISWADAPLWRKVAVIVLAPCSVLLFIGLGASYVLDLFFPGT